MIQRISSLFSFGRGQVLLVLLCGVVEACGSSGSDPSSQIGAGGRSGDGAGQSSGGTAGSKAAGAGAGGMSIADMADLGGAGNVSGTGGSSAAGVEVGYCSGEAPKAGYAVCTKDADCSGSTPLCRDEPYSGQGTCGPCPQPANGCTDDASCGGGICVSVKASQCCSQVARECAPACTATSCGADNECASNGHCVPKSCTVDWTCPADYRCTGAGTAGADAHGCQSVPCTDGYTCPSQYTCSNDASVPKDSHGCAVVHCSQSGATCRINSDCVANAPNDGCVVRQCKTSGDCDCGTCRDGRCANRPGICVALPPV